MCTCSGGRTARTPTRRTRKLFWRTLWESNFHPSERPPSLKVQYPVPIIIHAKASVTWRWFCFSVFPKTKSTLTSQTESICEGMWMLFWHPESDCGFNCYFQANKHEQKNTDGVIPSCVYCSNSYHVNSRRGWNCNLAYHNLLLLNRPHTILYFSFPQTRETQHWVAMISSLAVLLPNRKKVNFMASKKNRHTLTDHPNATSNQQQRKERNGVFLAVTPTCPVVCLEATQRCVICISLRLCINVHLRQFRCMSMDFSHMLQRVTANLLHLRPLNISPP